MAYHYKGKQSLLFKEFTDEQNKKYFSFKNRKFLANIDSLYVSIITEDTRLSDGSDPQMEAFRKMMDEEKAKARENIESEYVPFSQHPYFADVGEKFIMGGFGFSRYDYDLQKPDRYTAFLMGYRMTSNTPTAIVQIRSEALWLDGVTAMLMEVYNDMTDFYAAFGLKILEVRENRIDFAYHTNYIQNPTNYFALNKLGKIQQSTFERWSQEGAFAVDGQPELDYFTLGRRKSNNLFFRVYNKTKEVIEQGYKQFFFHLWLKNGLISEYDLYCYEKAFVNVSRFGYKHLNIARLEFYLEHGENESYKDEIRRMIAPDRQKYDHHEIMKFADFLTPPITLVLNVEIETKRKFHRTIDKGSAGLLKEKRKAPYPVRDLFKKLDNLKVYHDYLTCNNSENKGIIRFIRWDGSKESKSEMDTSDFWKRLQSAKFVHGYIQNEEEIILLRSYTESLNADLIKKKIANSLSTLSIYAKGISNLDKHNFVDRQKAEEDILNSSLEQDAVDFLSYMTENDIQSAIDYKKKKIPVTLNRVSTAKLDGSFSKHQTFTLLEKATGEIKAISDEV